MQEPTEQDLDQLMKELAEIGERDIKPKIRSSVFVLMPFAEGISPDPWFAMQLGLCLLYEKPLIVLVLKGAYVPPRVLDLADAVVRGETAEECTAGLLAAVKRVCAERKKVQ
jgi:hypothetical protein